MRFLVTGVNGQLGYDVVKELKRRGYLDVLAPSRMEFDITDREHMQKYIQEKRPDVIFHCAAYTNVDQAESNQEVAYQVNVDGTKNIVDMAKEIDAKVVYISTDYVFDGEKDGYYDVFDQPNPKSVYGRTKFLGEEEVRKYAKHFIVRVSWVFGINGNNFVKTMLKLSQAKTGVNVVSDQIGSPTYTVDLARLLVDIAKTEEYGLYHATNEGVCSWAEFASTIFKVNHKNVKVNYILSEEYPQVAKRPKNSKLSKSSLSEHGFVLLPTWQDALERFRMELESEEK